ncbi:MAG TPA: MOSC domain-containing protein [Terracidiphilus sp.]|nr:MOSC domain-containing protein [Terracidiphilus sp.]
MKILSIHCGLPREVVWHGSHVTTSIFKQPVQGRVALRTLNLDGDRQSDLTVHGGRHKAVYCYPMEHYAYWAEELPDRTLEMGTFGENFTTEGLLEDSIHIGDRFAVGSAEVVVSQPRLPCYKLNIKFDSNDMTRRFLASRRTGFYLAVTREGEVGAFDEFLPLSHDPNAVSISEITQLYLAKEYGEDDLHRVERALRVGALPDSWKDYLREKMNQRDA